MLNKHSDNRVKKGIRQENLFFCRRPVKADAFAKAQKSSVFGLVTYWYYWSSKTQNQEFARASKLV